MLVESAATTSMIFMILIGALIFANFINYTSLPTDLRTALVRAVRGVRSPGAGD